MFFEILVSWQWLLRFNVILDFNFDNYKVYFVFDVMNNLEKWYYKMESNFEEFDVVKIVVVWGVFIRVLLLQVSFNGFIFF